MTRNALVSLVNISKTYGRVFALENINLDLFPGEIVSLVGDNGAGKSTLTKIISGTEKPDAGGEIFLQGEKVTKWSSAKARSWGIETVYQNRALSEHKQFMTTFFLEEKLPIDLGL